MTSFEQDLDSIGGLADRDRFVHSHTRWLHVSIGFPSACHDPGPVSTSSSLIGVGVPWRTLMTCP